MRYGSLICSKKWLSERPNWRGMFLRLEGETVLDWCENMSCFSLSGCHMAVSQSWAGYHTSFERGDSGPRADVKIRTFGQLIGILWSYFGVHLGSTNEAQHFSLSLWNSLEQNMLPYLIWKGTSIAFIWGIAAWSIPRGSRVMNGVPL